jgi:hypothetical protein
MNWLDIQMIERSAVFFFFFTLHFLVLFFLSFCLFSFSNSNLPFDVCSCEKILLLVFYKCFGVQV